MKGQQHSGSDVKNRYRQMKEVSFNFDMKQEVMVNKENSEFGELVDTLMEKLCCEPWFAIVKMKRDYICNVMEALEAIKCEIDGLLLIFKMLSDSKVEYITDSEIEMGTIYNENRIIYMEIVLMNDDTKNEPEEIEVPDIIQPKQGTETYKNQDQHYNRQQEKIPYHKPNEVYKNQQRANNDNKRPYELGKEYHNHESQDNNYKKPSKPDQDYNKLEKQNNEYKQHETNNNEYKRPEMQYNAHNKTERREGDYKKAETHETNYAQSDIKEPKYRPRIKDLMENEELRQQIEQQDKRLRQDMRDGNRKDSGTRPYERKPRTYNNDDGTTFKPKQQYNNSKPRYNERTHNEDDNDAYIPSDPNPKNNKEVETVQVKPLHINTKPYMHYGSYKNALDGNRHNKNGNEDREEQEEQYESQYEGIKGNETSNQSSENHKYERQVRKRIIEED